MRTVLHNDRGMREPQVPFCRPLPAMGDRRGRGRVPSVTSTGAPASVTGYSQGVAKAFATPWGRGPLRVLTEGASAQTTTTRRRSPPGTGAPQGPRLPALQPDVHRPVPHWLTPHHSGGHHTAQAALERSLATPVETGQARIIAGSQASPTLRFIVVLRQATWRHRHRQRYDPRRRPARQRAPNCCAEHSRGPPSSRLGPLRGPRGGADSLRGPRELAWESVRGRSGPTRGEDG